MIQQRIDDREQRFLKKMAEEKANFGQSVDDVNNYKELIRLEFNDLMIEVAKMRAHYRLECLKIAATMLANGKEPWDEGKAAGIADNLMNYIVPEKELRMIMPDGLDKQIQKPNYADLKPVAQA